VQFQTQDSRHRDEMRRQEPVKDFSWPIISPLGISMDSRSPKV
jgi:hypothetical protein